MIHKEAWHIEADEREVHRAIEEFRRDWSEEGLLKLLRITQRSGGFEFEVERFMSGWAADEVRKLVPEDMTFIYRFEETPRSFSLIVTYGHPTPPLDPVGWVPGARGMGSTTSFTLRPAVGFSMRKGKLLYWFLALSGPLNRSLLKNSKVYTLPDFVEQMVNAIKKSPPYSTYYHGREGGLSK